LKNPKKDKIAEIIKIIFAINSPSTLLKNKKRLEKITKIANPNCKTLKLNFLKVNTPIPIEKKDKIRKFERK
tara:strand:- start:2421 stop:2636 length:216 start_codon:yes stop_codon:yes gene_type:complete